MMPLSTRIFSVAFVSVVFASAAFGQDETPKGKDAIADPVKTKTELEVALESSPAGPFTASGSASMSAVMDKSFSVTMSIRTKDTDKIDLDEACLGFVSGMFKARAGYLSEGVGAGLFRGAAKRLTSSRGLVDELADDYGYTERGLGLALGLGYQKDCFPYSLQSSVRILEDSFLPAFAVSSAFHLGKRDRFIGLSGCILPVYVIDPLNGERLDIHAFGSLYGADFEADFVWSAEAAIGTEPDKTPWAFPQYLPTPMVVWCGAEITTGYRIAIGTLEMIPGAILNGHIPDLASPADFAFSAFAGVKLNAFKGCTLWAWGGIRRDPVEGSLKPAWDFGISLDL